MLSLCTFPSPIGTIGLSFNHQTLIGLKFLSDDAEEIAPSQPWHHAAIKEFEKYFEIPSYRFSLDFELRGTPFQQKVWGALKDIPYGATSSYGVLAKQLKTSSRAVGQGCRTNPIPLIIPCHRIIAAKQQLGGYSGEKNGRFMFIKQWLLQREGVQLCG